MSDYVDNVADSLDRQILFNMPLRKAIVLFSALLFTIIVVGSSLAYYFAMHKILSESLAQELKQTLYSKQLFVRAEMEKETLLLKVLSEHSEIRDYFMNPDDEDAKKNAFAVFEQHRKYFRNKIVSWINPNDSNYYVNGEFTEKYNENNSEHSWFFEALKNKNPPLIMVNFDYLTRQIHDLYIDYPVYSKDSVIIGIIASRISLLEFLRSLDLPKNVLVFGRNGVVISASDEKIPIDKKTLEELFGSSGKEVHEKALGMDKNACEIFSLIGSQFVLKSMRELDLFLVAKDNVNMEKIIEERASIIFLALLLLMLVVVVIFNKFIIGILKPINKNMMAYIESSLLDELTKIPNRRFYNMRMEDEWNRAVRGKYTLSYLMMDLDKFKIYNDTYGHLEGDKLLKEVAKVFGHCVNRTSDFAARFGGEEFCVILPNTKLDGARKIAESIRVSMERTGKATISIGLVCKVPSLEDNMQEFVDQADQKLYEAKNTGRNKVCW
ncbi:MAG: sensor domain-containing diguanylate cyclase [Fibromonadales bacterium]|nr:sensor domain-containing diguanylate cyclase [Fibromonadales bacterium]